MAMGLARWDAGNDAQMACTYWSVGGADRQLVKAGGHKAAASA
jgi:hypothetical protein